MHELAITQSILNICLKEEELYKFKTIKTININLGEFTGLIPKSITYYFKIISKGTSAENAKINIKKIPVNIKCNLCFYEGEIKKEEYTCPKCNGIDFKILNGNEFFIESLEVE